MQLKWKGPLEGGLSQSILTRFQGGCPWETFLYLGLGLDVPEEFQLHLAWGNGGHKGLEVLLNTVAEPSQKHRQAAMAEAVYDYMRENYKLVENWCTLSIIEFLKSYDDKWVLDKEVQTEVVFAKELQHGDRRVLWHGKYDCLTTDNKLLGEHKFKKFYKKGDIREEVKFDIQLHVYTETSNCFNVVYDVLGIPDLSYKLPPRRKYENDAVYIRRIYHEHAYEEFPIAKKKHLWREQFPVNFTPEDIQTYRTETLDPLVERIWQWYDYVSAPEFDPEHPKYNYIFYKEPLRLFDSRKTESFKSRYHNLSVGNWTLDQLVPVQSYFSELEV